MQGWDRAPMKSWNNTRTRPAHWELHALLFAIGDNDKVNMAAWLLKLMKFVHWPSVVFALISHQFCLNILFSLEITVGCPDVLIVSALVFGFLAFMSNFLSTCNHFPPVQCLIFFAKFVQPIESILWTSFFEQLQWPLIARIELNGKDLLIFIYAF